MVKRAKQQLERWMEKRCDIYGWEEEQGEDGVVEQKEVLFEAQVPCRISYAGLGEGKKGTDFLSPKGTVVLFTAAEVELPLGAVVRIDQKQYRQAGESRTYPTHRETVLVPFGEERV